MTWRIVNAAAVANQAIATVSSTQAHPLGTIFEANDDTGVYGEGEFIYLKGVTLTVVGSLVTYNPVAGTTTRIVPTANQGKPVAVAMAACTASMYGWYQISGGALAKKAAVKVSPNAKVFLSATTGRITGATVSGKAIVGAVSICSATVASATSTVQVLLQRPCCQGQTI